MEMWTGRQQCVRLIQTRFPLRYGTAQEGDESAGCDENTEISFAKENTNMLANIGGRLSSRERT
jgi:hypothetical protein